MTQTTQAVDPSSQPTRLYMAFELAKKSWKIGFSDGRRERVRTIPGRDLVALALELELAKKRLQLEGEIAVMSCYEAGLDGFWLHRELERSGMTNCVVDPGSIERPSRKHAKTDKLDVKMLLRKLIQHHRGDSKVWSVVRVPSAEAEDERCPYRERQQLKKERGAHVARMKALLLGQGIVLEKFSRLGDDLEKLGLGRYLEARLRRELSRLALVDGQLAELKAELERKLEDESSPALEKVKRLRMLKGIGPVGSHALVVELFGWRSFNNRKELAGCVGLTGTPHNTGESERERGISKTGRPALRALLVELSWGWVRFQPQSKLAQWFHERFGQGKRHRKIGIVALARKLLIALWRFVEQGKVPEGALLKVGEA
jgi:transposase